MKLAALLLGSAVLAGCAGFSGRGLLPGQSTEQEVEALMGPSADIRKAPNGDTLRYYSREPYGRHIYVARIGSDGKLRSLEDSLTDANIAKLRLGSSRDEDVRTLVGPPYRVDPFPRMQREVWTYKMFSGAFPKDLYVQFSPDHVVREVMIIDDPEYSAHNAEGP
ncbi:MAG TPA: hypothetical protein VI321_05280 [Burkholderiales bacterium]